MLADWNLASFEWFFEVWYLQYLHGPRSIPHGRATFRSSNTVAVWFLLKSWSCRNNCHYKVHGNICDSQCRRPRELIRLDTHKFFWNRSYIILKEHDHIQIWHSWSENSAEQNWQMKAPSARDSSLQSFVDAVASIDGVEKVCQTKLHRWKNYKPCCSWQRPEAIHELRPERPFSIIWKQNTCYNIGANARGFKFDQLISRTVIVQWLYWGQ